MKHIKVKAAKRRVHFAVNKSGQIAVDLYMYEMPHVDCHSDLHNSQKEIQQIQYKCKKLMQTYAENNPLYHEHLERCFDYRTVEDLTIFTMACSPARGLETRVSKLIKLHRKTTVNEILKMQEIIKEGNKERSGAQRQTMLELGLRARSLQLSQKSKIFALRMAKADEIAKDLKEECC